MSIDPANLSVSDCVAEPSAKRRRTNSMSPEERKEARAHRNRIAAQNSRDRRKAHYTLLEGRVAELEAENRQLKAQSPAADTARENAELRERIKTLENGWQTVLTALAAQGLPLPGLTPGAPPVTTTTTITSSAAASSSEVAAPLSSFPPPTLPLSPAPTHESPQESVSHDFDSPSPLAFAPSPLDLSDFDAVPTEVQPSLTDGEHPFGGAPAAGGTSTVSAGSGTSVSGPFIGSNHTGQVGDASSTTDQAMENFLNQILVHHSEETSLSSHQGSCLFENKVSPVDAAVSPQLISASDVRDLGVQWNEGASPLVKTETEAGTLDLEIPVDLSVNFDWTNVSLAGNVTVQPELNEEMQRMLDTYTWGGIQV